jgi:hypothetical protein
MLCAGNAAGRRPDGRPDDRIKTVTRMWRTGWTGAAALAALALSVTGPAAGPTAGRSDAVSIPAAPRVLASNGAVVVMPEIAGLDCAGMSQVLRRIDLSNYRGLDPVPEGHPDRPIYDYEDRLTGRYYYSCTLSENRLEDPGAAFSYGFEQK